MLRSPPDLPGAVPDHAVEEQAAVVLTAAALLVREVQKLGRQAQGFGHVHVTGQEATPIAQPGVDSS